MELSLQKLLPACGMILSSALPLAGILLGLGLFRRWHLGAYDQTLRTNVARLRARSWLAADALLLLFAIMLPMISAVLTWFQQDTSAGPEQTDMRQLVPYMVYYALLLLGVGMAAQRTSLGIAAVMGISRDSCWPAIRTGVILGLAMLPPVLLTAGLADSICQWLGTPPSRQAVFDVLNAPDLNVMVQGSLFFMAVVAAPLVEETVFRGILLPLILRTRGLLVALLLVNVLFALLHLHAPSFLPLLAVGVCLSLGMLATGSVLTPIVMHAIFNAEMLLLFYAWP
ncbi:MAG: CPBP family intramembrane glutamic endopeptidase [Kiritimatiellia bacterium]